MAKITFASCTAAQFQTKVTGSQLVVGRLYFVLNDTILSILKAISVNTYVICYQDAIASKPVVSSDGRGLTYKDSSGTSQTIDLMTMTVGDKTSRGQALSTSFVDGYYMGTIGNAASGATVTALPSSGMAQGDYYKVLTAATYGGVACVVGDFIKCTNSSTPTWAKDNTLVALVGDIKNGDTFTIALGRLANRLALVEEGASTTLATKAELEDDVDYLQGQINAIVQSQTSMLQLLGEVNSQTQLYALTALHVGSAYRIATAGTYAGAVCEVGDVITVISIAGGTGGNQVTWMVLQNNLDLAGLVVGAETDGGLEEVAGATGKKLKLPAITISNTTSSASPAFGATIDVVDSVTRDAKGRVTAINIKTVTLPTQTVLSGLSSNADASYKVMVNLTTSGHALTATYAGLLTLLLTGWAVTADVGAIAASDSLMKALSRLQNRILAAETRLGTVEGYQDWIEG